MFGLYEGQNVAPRVPGDYPPPPWRLRGVALVVPGLIDIDTARRRVRLRLTVPRRTRGGSAEGVVGDPVERALGPHAGAIDGVYGPDGKARLHSK